MDGHLWEMQFVTIAICRSWNVWLLQVKASFCSSEALFSLNSRGVNLNSRIEGNHRTNRVSNVDHYIHDCSAGSGYLACKSMSNQCLTQHAVTCENRRLFRLLFHLRGKNKSRLQINTQPERRYSLSENGAQYLYSPPKWTVQKDNVSNTSLTSFSAVQCRLSSETDNYFRESIPLLVTASSVGFLKLTTSLILNFPTLFM